MRNYIIIIIIILILLFAMCKKAEQEATEPAGIGEKVDRKHVNPEFASTYLGGKGNEFCEAIALDEEGNIYVTGNTRALDFPTTNNTYNQELKGESDVFIAKFDNNLKTLLASTLIGGSEGENAYTMLFDPKGYIYIAGYTFSQDFPATDQAYDNSFNGGDGDAFILKMDKDLKTLVAATFLGGSGAETDWRSPEIMQYSDGSIYLSGNTSSDDFPTTPGAYQEKFKGGRRDVFLSKFDSDLTQLQASTLIGGSGDESLSRSLSIDVKNNEICIGGYTFSQDFPTTQNAYGREASDNLDGFISKFNMDLKELTASTLLKAGWLYSMLIHDNGDIYVGGHAVKSLPTTANAFYPVCDKAYDQGFISLLSNDLSTLKASTFLPGTYSDGGGRICSLNLCQAEDGHILSAGWVSPVDFPSTPGVYDETVNGKADTYILKMDKDLSRVLLSTFIGGSRSERWNRMETDKSGKIYIASYTLSADFPTNKDSAFNEFGDVITDEEEDLGTSPTDASIIKIDKHLSASVFEEFHDQAKRDHAKKLEKMLSTDRNLLDKRDKYLRAPLHSAARFGAFSAAHLLLDQGADANVKDENGNTPLHLASIFQNNEIIDLLLKHQAEVAPLNSLGQTPLYLATLYGNPECIGLLLAAGADINCKDTDGNTLLHIAVKYRNSANITEILGFNPDINAVNGEGLTPLHLAVQRPDNENVLEILLQKGADVNLTDSSGKNALLLSVSSNQKGYISLLVLSGIDINSQDSDGNTALHYPLRTVLKDKRYLPFSKLIAEVLIGEGADPHIKNKEGKSPMDLAEETGENEMIELLK